MGYSITNIEYGTGPWGTEVLYGQVGNPRPGETEHNVHSVTLLQGEGRNILVDTGVDADDPAKAALWNQLIDCMFGTAWALEQVGLTPEDIDTVILTHAHLDHVGAVERFTNAKIYLQKKEFEAWERMAADPAYLQLVLPAAMPSDYPPMRKMIDAGQIVLLDGDTADILPGIDLHVVYDCHSVAEQLVIVNNPDGVYIVGGDIACRPANLIGMGDWKGYLVPTLGRSGSAVNVCEAYAWVLDKLDGDMGRLVLTHDSTMAQRFDSKPTKDGLFIHYVAR